MRRGRLPRGRAPRSESQNGQRRAFRRVDRYEAGAGWHGRWRAWAFVCLYIRVRDCFVTCEEDSLCGKCAGNAVLGCAIVIHSASSLDGCRADARDVCRSVQLAHSPLPIQSKCVCVWCRFCTQGRVGSWCVLTAVSCSCFAQCGARGIHTARLVCGRLWRWACCVCLFVDLGQSALPRV